MRRLPSELQSFLSPYPAHVVRLFRGARRIVLTAAPEANELVYDAYNAVSAVYSFSDRLEEAFCHVAAYSGHVNLGFNFGARLADPQHLLSGSGRSIRHVRLEAAADLRTPGLQALVEQAAARGRELVSELPAAPTSRVRPTTGGKRRPPTR